MTHLALLRGINVGGHKKVPMAELRKAFSAMGFTRVQTLLASGNVLFEAEAADPAVYVDKIASTLEQTFGFPIPILLRPFADIERMIRKDPFQDIDVTPRTKLNVTFLPAPASTSLELPYTASGGAFRIIAIDNQAVFTVLDLDRAGSVDMMQVLDKEFGKDITTRTWNTVLKIGEKGGLEG